MINSVEQFEEILNNNIMVEGGFANTKLYKESMKPAIEKKFPVVLEKIELINSKISNSVNIKVKASVNGELTSETQDALQSFLLDITVEEAMELQYQMIDTEELLEARGTILHSTIGYIITALKQKIEKLGDNPQVQVCEQLLSECMNVRHILINEIFGELNQKAQALDYLKDYFKSYIGYIGNPIKEYISQIVVDEVELNEMSEEQKKKNLIYKQIGQVYKLANNIQIMIDKVKGPVDELIENNGIGNPLYPPFISSVSSIKTNNYISSFY